MYDLIRARTKYKELLNKYLPSIMESHDRAKNEVVLVNRSCWNKKAYLYYIYIYLQIVLEQEVAQGKSYDEVYASLHLAEFDCLFKLIDEEPVEPELYIKAYPEDWYCEVDYKSNSFVPTGRAYAGTVVYKVYRGNQVIDTITTQVFNPNYGDFEIIDDKKVVFNSNDYNSIVLTSQVNTLQQYYNLPIRVNESLTRENYPDCASQCVAVLLWTNPECTIGEPIVIGDKEYRVYRPISINKVVYMYLYSSMASAESAMEGYKMYGTQALKDASIEDTPIIWDGILEGIAGNRFPETSEILFYTESQLNSLLIRYMEFLRRYVRAWNEEDSLNLPCDNIEFKQINSFWSYNKGACATVCTAEGNWTDKVCYILPDGTLNGECYYLNLNIEVTCNSNT